MTDHQKLLCTLLSENEDTDGGRARQLLSPLRVVAVLLSRRENER